MRIGIDIDDTLVDTSESFDNVRKKYNINFPKDWKEEWTQDERDFIFGMYLDEILIGAKIKEKAKDVIDYLNDLGHELFIITARNNKYCKEIEEKTIKFIEKEKLKVSNVYMEQSKKSDLAKKLNIDLMIDDSIYVYNNMKQVGIDCILFGDKIKTWDEVLKYIRELEE